MSIVLPDPIKTPRLTIRIIEAADLSALRAYYTDPDYLRYLPNTPWIDEEDGQRWFARIETRHAEGSLQQFVIEERNTAKVIGICLLFNFNPTDERAELGYALGPAHHGKGYMQEALAALLDFAFTTRNLRRLDAVIDPRNLPSAKILTRAGFRAEGVKREYTVMKGELVDTAMFGLLKKEWMANRCPTSLSHAANLPTGGRASAL